MLRYFTHMNEMFFSYVVHKNKFPKSLKTLQNTEVNRQHK